ncbi:penicillin-binding protein 2 [bacterium]|nr:penicillin-binding protein 2 [bacterium]
MNNPFSLPNFDFKPIKIKRKDSSLWQGDEIFLPATDESITRPIKEKNLKIFFYIVLIIFSVITLRIFYLQILRGSYFYKMAETNRIRIEKINAPRGLIFDKSGKVLAKNLASFSLTVVPADLPREKNEYQKLINKVYSYLKPEFRQEFKKNLSKIPRYALEKIVLLRNIDYQDAMLLKIKLVDIPAFSVETDLKRSYPEGKYFSHLLGYLGKISPEDLKNNKNKKEYVFNDLIGKSGLELFYEKELRGISGQKEIEVDRLGKEKQIINIKEACPGDDLYLTIDSQLQKKLFKTLTYYARLTKSYRGAAVALNPRNGKVLALVSIPSYDNNQFIKGFKQDEYQKLKTNSLKPLFFRAISGEYPPGSIIKLIIAAAALQEKIINKNTTILSAGGIRVGKWFFPDWKKGGHGPTNVIKALAESVNTFFYYVGGGYKDFVGLGTKKIAEYAKSFGLGKKTGIDLYGEKSGFIPTPEWKKKTRKEKWYIGDTYHISIGQGDILVTPIQVANYTAAIANGGKLFQPHLIEKIVSFDGKIKYKFSKDIIRDDFVDKENIEIIKQGLRAAVLWGSARGVKNVIVPVAGKTGTAQISKKLPHAWFTCFAPFNNPEIVLTILIENGGEGSSVAVPVARDVLNWYFSQKK